MHWVEECHIFCSHNSGKVDTRYNFSGIFRSPWVQGMSLHIVMAIFWEVGVYPTNRDSVLSKLPIQSTDSQQLHEHPSIPMPFVAFCTPQAQPVQTPQPSLPTPECPQIHTQGRAEIPVTPTNIEASVLHMATPVPSSLPCQFTPAEV